MDIHIESLLENCEKYCYEHCRTNISFINVFMFLGMVLLDFMELQILFLNNFTYRFPWRNLHSYQKWTRITFSPYSDQFVLFPISWHDHFTGVMFLFHILLIISIFKIFMDMSSSENCLIWGLPIFFTLQIFFILNIKIFI